MKSSKIYTRQSYKRKMSDEVFIPKETLEQLKTKAFLEMHQKLLKLEEEVKILTEIIRNMEQKHG